MGVKTGPASQFAASPRPRDDGAARGIEGRRLPATVLPSTIGPAISLADAGGSRGLVLYVYPHATGIPGQAPAPGWSDIPGAIGCTAESCAFGDRDDDFQALGFQVLGLSAQPVEEQRQFAARKALPFPLVSDARLELARAIGLPTFEAAGMRLYKRVTLIAEAGRIVKVFYPVFPPDLHPAEVLDWVRTRVD